MELVGGIASDLLAAAGLVCCHINKRLMGKEFMKKFIVLYNSGFGENSGVFDAGSAIDADYQALELCREEAENNFEIEVIEFNKENCDNHGFDYEEEVALVSGSIDE